MLMIRGGRFVDCNQATVDMLGYSDKAELLDTHPSELSPEVQPDGQKSFDKAEELMNTAISLGTHRFEWDHKRKSGEVFPVEVSLTAIPADDGYMLHTVWRDVTERKKSEIERTALLAQLHQSQKMEAIGHLAGGIAHDFNNLLQVMLGYGEIALLETDKNDNLRTSIENIMSATERATTLVDQLLSFSRRQVLEVQGVDLGELVLDVAEMIQRVIGDHITLEIQGADELNPVNADKGQLGQVLMNLCVNARDAMPTGGVITIKTENVNFDVGYQASHDLVEPGQYVLMEVSDTGCGMDSETVSKAFEPFFSTKAQGRGTGLGLATVYGLVQQHGGIIDLSSDPGQGAMFKIYLPRSVGAVSPTIDKPERTVIGGNETILVADDEESVCAVNKAILTDAGYTVFTAIDGEDAIRVFDLNADEIDMALLDVVMPKLGGRAVYDHIHARFPSTRVLFASGYSTDGIHSDFVLEEGMHLLKKPFFRYELLQAVREILDSRVAM